MPFFCRVHPQVLDFRYQILRKVQQCMHCVLASLCNLSPECKLNCTKPKYHWNWYNPSSHICLMWSIAFCFPNLSWKCTFHLSALTSTGILSITPFVSNNNFSAFVLQGCFCYISPVHTLYLPYACAELYQICFLNDLIGSVIVQIYWIRGTTAATCIRFLWFR